MLAGLSWSDPRATVVRSVAISVQRRWFSPAATIRAGGNSNPLLASALAVMHQYRLYAINQHSQVVGFPRIIKVETDEDAIAKAKRMRLPTSSPS
jgi:hypothetical protein